MIDSISNTFCIQEQIVNKKEELMAIFVDFKKVQKKIKKIIEL